MSRTVDDVCHIPFVNQYVSVWVNLSVCQLLVLIDILWLLPEGVGEEGEEGGGVDDGDDVWPNRLVT